MLKQVPSPPASPPQQICEKEEGSLLLWLEGGVMLSLTSVAAAIWKRLEENPAGMTLSALVDYIEQECKGDPDNQVSREKIESDLGELLGQLHGRGLIHKRKVRRNSPAIYQVTQGVLRTEDRSEDEATTEGLRQGAGETAATTTSDEQNLRGIKLILTPAMSDHTLGITALEQVREINRYRSKRHTCLALLAFLTYDLALFVLGFSRVCRIISGWPGRKRRSPDVAGVKRVCAGIERARIWYPKKVMCMQHSAVVRCLLRYHGVLAWMPVGGRRMPFRSHAWVVVAKIVINDTQKVETFYKVFARY